MAKQDYPIGSGALKIGLKIGEETHRDFVIREGDMGDYFAAEDVAPVEKSVTFDAALLCQRLERIGTFYGPFTLKILSRLKPADFKILRDALYRVDAAGEPKPAPSPTD